MSTSSEKTGEALNCKLVEDARNEELMFMRQIKLHDDATVSERYANIGKPPIDTKWVDVNNGLPTKPRVVSGLVARDFKPKGEQGQGATFFAVMPPLEAKKMLFAMQPAIQQYGGPVLGQDRQAKAFVCCRERSALEWRA